MEFLILGAVIIFFLPSMVAFLRGHPYKWIILVVNLFGWTGIGWLAALIWSVWPSEKALADPVIGNVTGIGARNTGHVLGENDFGREHAYAVAASKHVGDFRLEPTFAASTKETPSNSSSHQLELLSKLVILRDAGALTQEEFEAKKTEILQGM